MSEIKPIKRILYATNLGPNMTPVFGYALNLAKVHNAKLIMLHAVAPLGSTGQTVLSLYLPQQQVEDVEKENLDHVIHTMRERLENYCSNHVELCKDKEDLIENVVVAVGKPAKVIEQYAEEHNADLIVVGSHTRESSSGLLGSTARSVTQHSNIPVLVVPNGAGA